MQQYQFSVKYGVTAVLQTKQSAVYGTSKKVTSQCGLQCLVVAKRLVYTYLLTYLITILKSNLGWSDFIALKFNTLLTRALGKKYQTRSPIERELHINFCYRTSKSPNRRLELQTNLNLKHQTFFGIFMVLNLSEYLCF